MHTQRGEIVRKSVHFFGKLAGEGAGGRTRRLFRARVNQVGYTFGLRQIQFSIEKSTLGKFAGACNAATQRQAPLQQSR